MHHVSSVDTYLNNNWEDQGFFSFPSLPWKKVDSCSRHLCVAVSMVFRKSLWQNPSKADLFNIPVVCSKEECWYPSPKKKKKSSTIPQKSQIFPCVWYITENRRYSQLNKVKVLLITVQYVIYCTNNCWCAFMSKMRGRVFSITSL